MKKFFFNKSLFVYLAMCVALSMPASLFAQQGGGGLLGGGDVDGSEEPGGGMLRGGHLVSDNELYGYGNQPFGVKPTNYAPLGSGVFMLVAAGVGYALVKSKKSDTLNK